MIILDELPFSCVEKEGFKKFCEEVQPRFHVVCRTTITKDCLKMFIQEKAKLKAYLKENSCRKKIINFRVLAHPHTGEAMAKAIESCLVEWELEKVMTITLDNARNNDSCVVDLRKRLLKRNSLLLGGSCIQVRCLAHVTNLVVKVGVEEVQPTIKRLRRSVKYVRNVKTRWNSTYLMINVALELEKAFECLKDDPSWKNECRIKGGGVLEDEDWECLRSLHTFLQEFYTLTKRISGSKYITSNTYFDELVAVKDLLMDSMAGSDELFKTMGTKMNEKFDKYCQFDSLNMLLVVAIVLDPRFKIHYVEFCYASYVKKVFEAFSDEKKEALLVEYKLDEVEGSREEIMLKLWEKYENVVVGKFIVKLKNLMYELYLQYKLEMPLAEEPIEVQDVSFVDTVGTKRVTSKELFRNTMKRKDHVEALNDLDKYLNDSVVDEDGSVFNALEWWREKVTTYHALAFVARDVLTIPITSVASECAFSTAGRVLDPFRSSLTPTIVESLVCTQDWLRSPIPLIDVEEQLESLEEIERVVLEELRALDIGSATS
ncbi:cellulase [Ranunculus cassubicifolius]